VKKFRCLNLSDAEIPPAVQEQLVRFQQIQQTLQAVVAQRQQVEMELMGVEKALEELEKADDNTIVYKSVGSLLIKADRRKLIDELKDQKELLNARLTILNKQETRARAQLKEAREKLQEKLKGVQMQE
jgi:prefoldin beta subunit